MATVCGASLALMDAGVPLARPVAGIAMGLILEGKDFAVISDILGDEDHLGDMDFKVAGTSEGVTALQMDIKVAGITEEIMRVALGPGEGRPAAHPGRDGQGARHDAHRDERPRAAHRELHRSTRRRSATSSAPAARSSARSSPPPAPRSTSRTTARSRSPRSDPAQIEAAKNWILGITQEAEVGKIYTGKVVSMVDFGAFVNFMGAKDGLVHISEIKNERVAKVSEVLTEGQPVKVKVLGIDDRGKVRLSMRLVDQETGEEIADTRPPREDGPRPRPAFRPRPAP